MGGVKRSLPDDWEPEYTQKFPREMGVDIKYICVGSKKVEAEWLPRWYEVPHNECVFRKYNKLFGDEDEWVENENEYANTNLIELIALPEGTDYVHYLKTLKTERLLNGNDVRKY